MAIQVNSMAELQRVLMEETYKALSDSSVDLIDEIKESVDETVYNYSPKRYERTNGLKESLEQTQGVNNGRVASITIGHNRSDTNWYSVKDGDSRDDIPEIVTYDGYGTFVGEGIDAHGGSYHYIYPNSSISKAWSKPRDYMKHAEEKVEGNGYRFLQGHLPSYARIK